VAKSRALAKKLPPDEEYVRVCLERHLGTQVEQYDDGSRPGMHDLNIVYTDRPAAPVEVSSDVNGARLATLSQLQKKADGGVWHSSRLARVWLLQAHSTLKVKDFWAVAEPHLALLESVQTFHFHASAVHHARIGAHFADVPVSPTLQAQVELTRLGVMQAQSYLPDSAVDQPGARLVLQGSGTTSGDDADSVVSWLNAFTTDPTRQDNLKKLRSPAVASSEAHLAVFADLNQVPFTVWRSIEDHENSGVLPIEAPILPQPVTHVWLFASPGGRTGLTWSAATGWNRFKTAH
jgi:hypothetical protein